ncbi:MAG: hypothetical protein MRY69_05070 [Phaeobacter italicus]|nr:hypothetical protein [Phaeobacter italicus]
MASYVPVESDRPKRTPKYRATIMRIVAGMAVAGAAATGAVSAHSNWTANSIGGSLVSSRGPQVKTIVRSKNPALRVEQPEYSAAENAKGILEYIANNSKLPTSEIARCLRVSRQAVYEWQKGKSISQENLTKLSYIRDAIVVLKEADVTPDRNALRRKIGGRSVLDVIAAGESGDQAAARLLESIMRERNQLEASKKTARALKGTKRDVSVESLRDDIGRPTRHG